MRLVRAAKVGDFLPHALGSVAVGQEGAWEAGMLPVDQDTPCIQDSSIFTLEKRRLYLIWNQINNLQ